MTAKPAARWLPLAGIALGALVGGGLSSCKCERQSVTSASSSASSSASASPVILPPLAAESWLVELPVEGFEAASAAVPLGAIEPRPVIIALHGGADRPEWQCGTWVGIARSHPFVLCPRGVAVNRKGEPPRYGWTTSEQVEKETKAALKSLKARFGAHVASGPVVLAAFSAGTRHAVDLARKEASFFSRMVLVAPEDDLLTAGLGGIFARSGMQRALFVCSDAACREPVSRYLVFTRGPGISTAVLDLPERGRVLDGAVAKAIAERFPWLVQGDARYPFAQPISPAPSASADGG